MQKRIRDPLALGGGTPEGIPPAHPDRCGRTPDPIAGAHRSVAATGTIVTGGGSGGLPVPLDCVDATSLKMTRPSLDPFHPDDDLERLLTATGRSHLPPDPVG